MGDDERDVFIRWAQFGAFLPFMENGGGGEHRPWMYDEEVTAIYKTYVLEHYRLIPYLMSAGMESMSSQGTSPAVHPVAVKDTNTPDYENPQPSTYSYRLGDDILVHPVLNEKGLVEMTFPAGCPDTLWLNWWDPLDTATSVAGQTGELTQWHHPSLDTYPVYVRRQALLPLQSTPTEEDVIFTWFAPLRPDGASEADLLRVASVPQPETVGPGLQGTATLSGEGTFTGTITAHPSMKSGWKLLGVTAPESVEFSPASACSYEYHSDHVTLHINCPDMSAGVIVTVTGLSSQML